METMNIAIPEAMKEFVQEQVSQGNYSSVSEYIRDLIRHDQKQKAKSVLEAEILKGLNSGESTSMTDDDWEDVRAQVRDRYKKRNQAA